GGRLGGGGGGGGGGGRGGGGGGGGGGGARPHPARAGQHPRAREVVHDDGDRGGRRHLAEARHCLLGLEVMKRQAAGDDVDGVRVKRQRHRIALDQQNLGVCGDDAPGERERRRVALAEHEADRPPAPPRPCRDAPRE